jgi:hypothetical protein
MHLLYSIFVQSLLIKNWKIFLTTRNLPRKFICWKRPYSYMKNSMLGYMTSLIRIYWCKNVIFSLEASTGNYCLLFRDLHTSLSITSVLFLFLMCNVSVYMTANLVFQCAERFWFFTVAASRETNTLHLCPKDRPYFSFCIHCFLIPLILSRYSTFKVKSFRYLYCTVATFRKLLTYYRHVGASFYHCLHLDNFIPLHSSVVSFRYLCFAVAIFTYLQSTVVSFR